jgi:hypothetical protein
MEVDDIIVMRHHHQRCMCGGVAVASPPTRVLERFTCVTDDDDCTAALSAREHRANRTCICEGLRDTCGRELAVHRAVHWERSCQHDRAACCSGEYETPIAISYADFLAESQFDEHAIPAIVVSLTGESSAATGLFVIGELGSAEELAILIGGDFLPDVGAVAIYNGTVPSETSSIGEQPISSRLLDLLVYAIDTSADARFVLTTAQTVAPTLSKAVVETERSVQGAESIARCSESPFSSSAFVVSRPSPGARNPCPGLVLNEIDPSAGDLVR